MATDPSSPSDHESSRVLVMAASTRTGSVNQALARTLAAELATRGESVSVVDLDHHPMPLYHGDLEAAEGVPASVARLAERMAAAEVLILVSPEYNGAFTPLLKNTVDWLTRVDKAVIAHLHVLLAAATPGKGGGARGLALVRGWMANIGVTVADHDLPVGAITIDEQGLAEVDRADLSAFLDQVPEPLRAVANPA